MSNMIKKMLVILPFIIFSSYHASGYYSGRFDAVMAVDLLLNLSPFYLFIFLSMKGYREWNWLDVIIRSLFYVYLFYLCIYTISSIPYFHFINLDVLPEAQRTLPRYNLVPFETITGSITPVNIYGNLILLLPFGVFIPLIYKRIVKLKHFLLLTFTTILVIENMQYLVAYIDGMFYEYPYDRSWDIDDFILNSIGATVGFLIGKFVCIPIYNKLLILVNFNIKNNTLRH